MSHLECEDDNTDDTINEPRQRFDGKELAGIALAAILMTGGVAFAMATPAQAAPPAGCTQTPGVPYKTSTGQIAGSGSANCDTSASRTFRYEVRRSQGPFDPVVATGTDADTHTYYYAYAANCDSGISSHHYYGMAYFEGYTSANSGNTATQLSTCS